MVNQVTQNPALNNQDMGGNRLTNLADAVNPKDAAAFEQVSGRTSGSSTVRQTVANGHVNDKGRPNLLVASDSGVKTQGFNDLLNSIRVYYDFDSQTVNDNYEDSVLGQIAVNNNGVSVSNDGIRGNAAFIDNGGQLQLNNQIFVSDQEFFTSWWVKAQSGGKLQIFFNESDSSNSNSFFLYIENDNTFAITTSDGSGQAFQVKTNSSYDVTEWHNVVYHRNGTTATIYVDDVADGSGTVFGGNISGNGDSVIGDATDFIGLVDEMGFWTRAVNSDDLELLYSSPLNVGLQAYYSFEGDITDELGSFDGTNNGSSFNTGIIGQAVQFDQATAQTFDIPGGALPANGNPFYLEFWYWTTSNSLSATIASTDVDNKFQIRQLEGNIQIRIFDSSTSTTIDNILTTSGEIGANEWNLIKVKSDGVNSIDVAINDTAYIGMSTVTFADPNTITFGIGITQDNRVDELAIWNRVLSSNEQSLLYNNNNGRSYDSMRDLNPLTYSEFSNLVTPHLTFGDGFASDGQRNHGVNIDTPKTWTSLPSGSVALLYLEYDPSTDTLTTGSTPIGPIYSNLKPSTAQIGTFWYPVDHRSRGEYLDNTGTWQPVLRLYVGEATTDQNGLPQQVITYAYLGRALVNLNNISGSSINNIQHNMGTNKFLRKVSAILNSSVANYPPGTRIDVTSSTPSGWVTGEPAPVADAFITHGSTFPNFTDANGGPAASDPDWTNFSLEAEYVRSF